MGAQGLRLHPNRPGPERSAITQPLIPRRWLETSHHSTLHHSVFR
jgi:hypothetical protein